MLAKQEHREKLGSCLLCTHYFCAKQNCFQEFLHASASQAASELREQSSFHWAAQVTTSTLSLVLISTEADTANQTTVKRIFQQSDKGFSITGFPSCMLDMTGSPFPIHLS